MKEIINVKIGATKTLFDQKGSPIAKNVKFHNSKVNDMFDEFLSYKNLSGKFSHNTSKDKIESPDEFDQKNI